MTNIGSPNDQYRLVSPSSVGLVCLLGGDSFRHRGESDGSDPLDEDYSMERRHYIPSYKALPLEVEDRELLCEYGVAIWRNPRIFVYYFLSICAFFVLLP